MKKDHKKITDTKTELVDNRRSVYGDPIETFPRVAQIWSGILGHEVTAVQVALCMTGYKLLRAAVTPTYADNVNDARGYLDIFDELVGEDMVHTTSVDEYREALLRRADLLEFSQG